MKNFNNINHPNYSESDAIKNGYSPLDAQSIIEKVIGHSFLGAYLGGFKYIIAINEDGSLEGKNNYEHYDTGRWSIDEKNNTLSVEWDFGWDKACSNLYFIDEEIRMYDHNSGEWRTSLTHQISKVDDIKNYKFILCSDHSIISSKLPSNKT